jgi:deoxyribodipyrimidine photo-lyase
MYARDLQIVTFDFIFERLNRSCRWVIRTGGACRLPAIDAKLRSISKLRTAICAKGHVDKAIKTRVSLQDRDLAAGCRATMATLQTTGVNQLEPSHVILWFRLDLRLKDNPALLAAAALKAPVVPVFIWAPEEEDPWPPGAASRWWLHHSLRSLEDELSKVGSKLTIRKGPAKRVLQELLAQTRATAVFWNRRYEPALRTRDGELKSALNARGVNVQSFNSALLFEPWTILNGAGRPFQVFSAFWKICLKQPVPIPSSPAPKRLQAPPSWPESLPLDGLELEPKIDWTGGLRAEWKPGETGAHQELRRFLKSDLANYSFARNLPARSATSRLSPHLHFGEISPREIWHAVLARRDNDNAGSADSYLREIGWREFACHLLFHFPFTTNEPLRKEFARFPWQTDLALLKAWQCGSTGYPLVDAGMRELWATGWMHNRVRMVVASFLTKDLRIRWEEGAYWFWDTLVDADLANNSLGWQWTAGCGADAAPYFRIFNPVSQSEKFDPEGDYIRKWVPELSRLAKPWIHKPWTAPEPVLTEAGVRLGSNYPFPIVVHEHARRQALEAFEQIRE